MVHSGVGLRDLVVLRFPATDDEEYSMSQQTTASGDTSDAAKAEANRVQQHAKSQAREVQGTAKEQAQRVADEAREQARSLVGDAREHALRQAEDQTGRLSQALHEWSRQADALLDGRPDDAGNLGSWAREASNQLERLANRVDERGFRGLAEDVQGFARRRPGAFLAGAAAAGFAVARLGRGAQGAQQSDESTSQPAVTAGTDTADSERDEVVVAEVSSYESTEPTPAEPVEPAPDEGTTAETETRTTSSSSSREVVR